jgi:hypothetical protein
LQYVNSHENLHGTACHENVDIIVSHVEANLIATYQQVLATALV